MTSQFIQKGRYSKRRVFLGKIINDDFLSDWMVNSNVPGLFFLAYFYNFSQANLFQRKIM